MNYVMKNYYNEIKFNQFKESLKLIIQNKLETPEKIFDWFKKYQK